MEHLQIDSTGTLTIDGIVMAKNFRLNFIKPCQFPPRRGGARCKFDVCLENDEIIPVDLVITDWRLPEIELSKHQRMKLIGYEINPETGKKQTDFSAQLSINLLSKNWTADVRFGQQKVQRTSNSAAVIVMALREIFIK